MASNDDEFLPCSTKRPRMDTIKSNAISNADNNIDVLTPLSPTNDLEHFPIELLMRIFDDIDDDDLLNLSIVSYRFGCIAKVVFSDRYADRYFAIDNESERQQTIFDALFSRFGSGIRAIKAIDIHGIDNSHWMAQMMHKHIGTRLQKLHFCNCSFRNGCDLLANHMSITHLTISGGDCDDNHWIHLPKYQNLRKFELRNFQFVTERTIDWCLRHNAQLEGLILQHASYDFSLVKLMEYVYKYLRHLKEFIVLDHVVEIVSSQENIEKFLIVTTGLESIGFTIHTQQMELNERLSNNFCKNVKLELLYNQINFIDMELNYVMAVACKFQNIERLSLNIEYVYHDTAPILALIERLPKLQHLCIPQMKKNLPKWTLSLLQKCEHLKQLVLLVGDGRPDEQRNGFHCHINAHFHGKFLNVKRNVEIEFLDKGRTIGRVTQKGIVWRNKVMHWIGYDSICGTSKVNLLDLANQTINNRDMSKAEHRNPFDLILDYLDLNSLYALHECSTQSKQLVDDYVQRHSDQGGTFVICDEFYLNFKGLQRFAPCVKILEVKLFDRYSSHMIKYAIGMCYRNLTKLCFRTRYPIRPDEFIFPYVEHYIFYGDDCRSHNYSCNLIEFVENYKDLKIIEFRTVVNLNLFTRDRGRDDGLLSSIPNLQTFTFKPKDEGQVKLVEELFAGNGTDIVLLE